LIYYVALKQFDYPIPGKTAFNSLKKALNFTNKKGQLGGSYKISDSQHNEFDHVVVEKRREKQGYNGLEKSNNTNLRWSNTIHGYDTRMNDIYDPFRIDPSSIHLY
tara:strand:- start:801 stop:1118 length:318 start_codon:yes stop_codon:yes gene_type:complete